MSQQFKVARIWDETSEIRCFELVPEDGHTLHAPEPGAHIDVHIADKLIRQYSLWNGPEDTRSYFIGVKKEAESRGGSAGMHGLAAGNLLTIGSPKNNFPMDADARKSILIAGGIGITPLLSMARYLAAEGRSYELHLFARSETHAPFKDLLGSLGNASFHLGLQAEARDALVDEILAGGKAEGAHVYTCGPKPFMNLIVTTAERQGWNPDRVHLEYFSADLPEASADDTAIEVVLAKSGRAIVVAPDQTITDALIAEGVDILTSCEQGVCGTCLTTVLEGEPDHRDVYLNPAERKANKTMLPCVSRCRGKRLVLDL
ncbi:PDR/VanB family oxidoreductase [Methylorubrum populi]|uniref:Flavodoxin reductases (Ferredoxin-NADPH reductases) family 1 n=1 Tax=Methylorubrum populi TaxID=223967 RepID=A0A833IZM8_9HYPH|nr:PDR/VanB family oxidoreductase [Methylorubrum populi]KAB7781910.1 Flavodoxin reductases (ferredoxin-NADPH reductases) family 1 [Methylorubrum populi]